MTTDQKSLYVIEENTKTMFGPYTAYLGLRDAFMIHGQSLLKSYHIYDTQDDVETVAKIAKEEGYKMANEPKNSKALYFYNHYVNLNVIEGPYEDVKAAIMAYAEFVRGRRDQGDDTHVKVVLIKTLESGEKRAAEIKETADNKVNDSAVKCVREKFTVDFETEYQTVKGEPVDIVRLDYVHYDGDTAFPVLGVVYGENETRLLRWTTDGRRSNISPKASQDDLQIVPEFPIEETVHTLTYIMHKDGSFSGTFSSEDAAQDFAYEIGCNWFVIETRQVSLPVKNSDIVFAD